MPQMKPIKWTLLILMFIIMMSIITMNNPVTMKTCPANLNLNNKNKSLTW